jgi:hypothetical protein
MTNKRTLWKAVVAFFIIQVLLVGSFIKTSIAETAPNREILGLMSELKVEGKEIVTSRTEYTKIFRKNSKTDTVLVSVSPLHYKDKAGKWQEIETAL